MAESKKNSSDTQKKSGEEGSFPIVAVGASAGGLEALEALFEKMPPETGAAFVVIQHTSPEVKSMLGDILQKHTRMRVLEIQEGMRPEPNHIYLNPPGKELSLIQSLFLLEESVASRGLRLPIDRFFRSLAQEKREKAICIVLSGTGSDGTLGLKAIKEVAGMAMVQEVEQAKYGGMPASAITTGLVDYVLPVEKMPEALMSYIKHPYLERPEKIEGKEKQFTGYDLKILELIRSTTGNDFSGYKPKTVRRRIERRMALHKIETVSDYHRFLQGNSREINLLFHELLIGVTQFFRDPEAFGALEETVIPKILERKGVRSPIRIWVPGCSTGEEALSLAMLFSEAMEKADKQMELQIFATDLDPDAIERARTAEYPEAITADVSEARLKRFFTKKDSVYRVKTELRETIVYAVQNLASDPPFSKLDLVSCRNVLIYMDGALQKKIIPAFHFTLNPDGFLFLGSSEAIGGFSSLFSSLDSKWKIFKVKKDRTQKIAPEHIMAEGPGANDFGLMKERIERESIEEEVDRLIIRDYAPATILINEKCEALFFRGPVRRYLDFSSGQASLNLLKIARSAVSFRLPSAVKKAASENGPVTIPRVQVKQNGHYRTVDITVRPVPEKGGSSGLMLVVFEEVLPLEPVRRKKGKSPPGEETIPRVVELESELQMTRESLQSTIEELEATNEELKSSNEELQSTNEEMQSTNEELSTSREELQSMNEELITVNSELEHKVDELTELNDDISNLFASTDIGTIFLDSDFQIKRFTPAMRNLFNLIPGDVGRPLRDITSKISFDSILDDAARVLETLQVCEKEVKAEGKRFLMRILPYRTRDNRIGGVVIAFMEVTELKRIEQKMEESRAYAEDIVNTVREPLLVLDGELKVVSANRSFYRVFGVSAEETEGTLIYNLGSGQWDIPELRRLLEEILPENTSFEDFEMEHDFPSIGKKRMLLNARRIKRSGDKPDLILVALEDVTKG